jgi:hypothetical protein
MTAPGVPGSAARNPAIPMTWRCRPAPSPLVPACTKRAPGEAPRYVHVVIRFFFTFAIIVVLLILGATVNLGKRTFFGHVSAIWKTNEAQDMKEGIKDKAAPAAEKLERGVKAGYREATKPDDAGSGPASAK